MTRTQSKELLTSDEVAQILEVSPRTVRLWRKAGRGPAFVEDFHGYRRRIRYRRSDVLAFRADRSPAERQAS